LAVQLACLIADHGTGKRAQVNVPVSGDWTSLSPRGASKDRQELAHTRLETMRPRELMNHRQNGRLKAPADPSSTLHFLRAGWAGCPDADF